MFSQIKYALFDIRNSKRICFLFLIEMIIVLFLVNMVSSDAIRVNNGLQRMDKLSQEHAYVNGDMTTNEKVNSLQENQKETVPKMKTLYNFVSSNYTKISYWEYETGKYVDQQPVVQAVTDKIFFDIYNIETIEGRMFKEEDFSKVSNIIPIVVGFNLKDKYKLGHEYRERDPNTGNEVTYKVIGVLKNNSSYPSLYDIGNNYSLNYRFFRPINNNLIRDFANLDMSLGSLVILTKDSGSVKKIENMSSDFDLFQMHFSKIDTNVSNYLKYYYKKLLVELLILIFVIGFAVFSMVVNIISILNKNSRDFAIHLICGARISDICLRFFFQLIILEFLAIIPTVIFGIRYKFTEGFISTILFGLIISLVILIFPIIKLNKKNPVLIARSEK